MTYLLIASMAVVALGFALVSKRLSTSVVTGPIVFVCAGLVAHGAGLHGGHEVEEILKVLAEGTLVLLLFSDAARIDLKALKREFKIPGRMLGIGMPLAIVLGTVFAHFCFPAFSWWECALLSTLLTPTDAALGQPVLASKAVPMSVRQAINVESGLNDGIAVPFVTLTVACAAMSTQSAPLTWSSPLVRDLGAQIAFGPVVGVAVGLMGAWGFAWVRDRQWMATEWRNIAGIALAVLAFVSAEAIGGSGFISAFVAGLVFGSRAEEECAHLAEFVENEGTLLMLLAFFFFGLTAAPDALNFAVKHPAVLVFGALSLTVARMVPVALSLIGSGFHPVSMLVFGWLGPRGLATLVFAIGIAHNTNIAHHAELFNAALAVMFASILLHGVTAAPLARAYGRFCDTLGDDAPEHGACHPHPLRLMGRHVHSEKGVD